MLQHFTMTRVLLSFLLLLVATNGVEACFTPPRPAMTHAGCNGILQQNMMARPQDREDPLKFEEEDSVVMTFDSVESPEEHGSTSLDLAGRLFGSVQSALSYVTMTAGIALSFGLLLNLCGYAYQVSLERGLEIETVSRMREITQFRAEVNSRPPSSLPK